EPSALRALPARRTDYRSTHRGNAGSEYAARRYFGDAEPNCGAEPGDLPGRPARPDLPVSDGLCRACGRDRSRGRPRDVLTDPFSVERSSGNESAESGS